MRVLCSKAKKVMNTNYYPTRYYIFLLIFLAFIIGCSSSNAPENSDGTKAVNRIFYDETTITGKAGNLYAVNPDVSGKTLLATDAIIKTPPRGNDVLLLRQVTLDSAEFIMTDPWGANSRILFTVAGAVYYYQLSPNIKYVAYGYKGAANWGIIVKKIEDNSSVVITDSSVPFSGGVPLFSSDSKKILTPLRDFNGDHLLVMDVDGTNRQIISDGILVATTSNTPAGAGFPTYNWSSDETKIFFFKETNLGVDINVYDKLSGTTKSLISDTLRWWNISLSPSGEYIPYHKLTSFSYQGQVVNEDALGIYNVLTMKTQVYHVPYFYPYAGQILNCDWSTDSKVLYLLTSDFDASFTNFFRLISFDVATGEFKPIDIGEISSYAHLFLGRSVEN